MIWFRIEYDDADRYKIVCKIGNIPFTSDLRYTKEELLESAVGQIADFNMDDSDIDDNPSLRDEEK